MTNRMLTVLLCLMPLSAAWAQPNTVAPELSWQAPRGCPTQAEVSAMLPRLQQEIEIAAVVERAGAGYRLRLRVRSERQNFERELQARACIVLAESTGFLVRLAASQLSAAAASQPAADGGEASAGGAPGMVPDSAAVSGADSARASASDAVQPREPGGSGTESSSLPESPEPAYHSADLPETTRSGPRAVAAEGGESGLHLRVGLGAAATDVLSGLSPHVALDVVLALAEWTLGVRLGALLHPELQVGEGASVDLRTAAVQLLGCRLWAVGAAQLGPCLSLSALYSVAHTRGLMGGDDKVASWLTAGPALMLQLRLTRVLLAQAEIGAWAALTPRPSFEVSETTLARAQTLAGYGRLGVSYELW